MCSTLLQVLLLLLGVVLCCVRVFVSEGRVAYEPRLLCSHSHCPAFCFGCPVFIQQQQQSQNQAYEFPALVDDEEGGMLDERHAVLYKKDSLPREVAMRKGFYEPGPAEVKQRARCACVLQSPKHGPCALLY